MTERETLIADLRSIGMPPRIADRFAERLDLDSLRKLVEHEQQHQAVGQALAAARSIERSILLPSPLGLEGDDPKTAEEIYAELLRLSREEVP